LSRRKLLGSGLETTIKANNNQARALYLAIASTHYRDTMQDSCVVMLKTASTIVRKLGAAQGEDGGQGEKLGPAGLGETRYVLAQGSVILKRFDHRLMDCGENR
jgi:hypothetical protein